MKNLCGRLSIRAFALTACIAASACGAGTTVEPSSTNLTASEVSAIATGMFGPLATSLKGATTTPTAATAPAPVLRSFAFNPLDTFQIPYTTVTPNRVSCPAGGSYSQNGGMSGSVNTDTALTKLSGTIIIVDTDCAYQAGTLINGDPYLSMLLDYTQTGNPWTFTMTMSGSWSITRSGRPTTRVSIDPSGVHITMSSTGSNRIQGSMTAYPGGTSVSLNQTF